MHSVIPIDTSVTEHFFGVMLGDLWEQETLIFQVFDDNQDRIARERDLARMRGETYHSPRARTRSGTWAQLKAPAQAWARDGCCVSWTLQRFEGKRRDHADYFRGIRCVALDFDRPDAPLPAFPVLPHAIVTTSPGKYHVYWRAELSREAFDRLMPVLVDTYGADPNAADVCRVLRLPGFPHQKRDQRKGTDGTPHPVQLLYVNPREPLREEPLWTAFQVNDWWQAHGPTNGHAPIDATTAPKTRRKTFPAILPNSGPIDWPAILKALTFLAPDERQRWLTVGMALASIAHPKARVVWDEWSQTSDKYDADDQSRTWDSFKEHTARVVDESSRVGLGTLFHLARANGYRPDPPESWKRDLLTTQRGESTENAANISLWLTHEETWKGRFWWDVVSNVPMCDDHPVTDQLITDIGVWLGITARIPVRSLRLLERCIVAVCQQTLRDPIREWLQNLPTWDKEERLEHWLSDVAESPRTSYGQAVSRLIPVSMVARAFQPGCLYRYVVIFEGPEESGKSSLVRALGGPWYANMSMMLESKEAHMAIQGVWVAEMTELDSLSRSEENRIKSFLTMTQDDFIPKYSNSRVKYPRRTVFIGTTNEEQYLKGLSGNTRFLPIQTCAIDVSLFDARREQIFAEALAYYQAHLDNWWALPDEAKPEAVTTRDERRQVNVYEAPLSEWLLAQGKSAITWKDIAEGFLQIRSPEGWRDKRQQMDVGQAMRTLGWRTTTTRIKKLVKHAWVRRSPEESPP